MSDREIAELEAAVRAKYARASEEPEQAQQQDGVSNKDLAQLLVLFAEFLKNFRAQQPIVNINPELRLPATQTRKTISRDQNGRIAEITEESGPKN